MFPEMATGLRFLLYLVLLLGPGINASPHSSSANLGIKSADHSTPIDPEIRRNNLLEIGLGGSSIDAGIGVNVEAGGGSGLRDGSVPSGFGNARLYQAYAALQAWKRAITADPLGILDSWVGSDVCNYQGVFCAPPPDNSVDRVVAGIDLNHAALSGTLVEDLGLLNDTAIFHINTNNFSGTIPLGFKNLYILSELDVSNNRFSGYFPSVVMALPNLVYLDIRFNHFRGSIPAEIFDKNLDALFVNNNNFHGEIPANLGNSPVSVLNFANNKLSGSIPSSICNMADRLNEAVLLNNRISGCLPDHIGALTRLTVLDVSFNDIGGPIPVSVGCLESAEQLNLAHNQFEGPIPDVVCSIQSLENLTVSYNYFTAEGESCTTLAAGGEILFDDRQNCIPGRPSQRSQQQCAAFAAGPKTCSAPQISGNLPCNLPPPVIKPPPPPLRYPSPPPPPPSPTSSFTPPPPPVY